MLVYFSFAVKDEQCNICDSIGLLTVDDI